MTGFLEGKVVAITGAGRGIGRCIALDSARAGARVVVADYGVAMDGSEPSSAVAEDVVAEIKALGGEAVAVGSDVGTMAGGESVVAAAMDNWGRIDGAVCVAGILRERMLFNMSEEEFDDVIRVHLKGTFTVYRAAAAVMRKQDTGGALIGFTSGVWALGSVAQANYSAAKGGIAALTLVQAAELGRYGVTANAIAPSARTRMTESVFGERMAAPDSGFDPNHAENVSPLVVWLGSAESSDVTGRVFEVEGGIVSVADGWQHGPSRDKGARWDPAELGPVVRTLLAEAPDPTPVYGAS